MFLDPEELDRDLDTLEKIEKSTIRLVTQAIYDFRSEACEIFSMEPDKPQTIGEDITREALDSIGMSRIPVRLFGQMDYKRARYVFNANYAIRQALFIDSKSEKVGGQSTATIQTSQTSMIIRQLKSGKPVEVKGELPAIIESSKGKCLVTTIFVKYTYEEISKHDIKLYKITVACLPNVMLQSYYNPSTEDGIWMVGRQSHQRGEAFRVRISFSKLKKKRKWRVQEVILHTEEDFQWDE